MRILGFVIAKENSNRFPNKNITNVNGIPLFYHSVNILNNASLINDVMVCTDSTFIHIYCNKNNIKTLHRPKNITNDNDSLFDVIKWSYQSLNIAYDYIIVVMANTIGNTSSDIDNAIISMESNNLQEIRSFSKQDGVENGIIGLTHKAIIEKSELSTYIGSIQTSAIEIHYKKDLNNYRFL